MHWIWAGFGFAFGAWLFVGMVRFIAAYPKAARALAVVVLKLAAMTVAIFISAAAGVSMGLSTSAATGAALLLAAYGAVMMLLDSRINAPAREP